MKEDMNKLGFSDLLKNNTLEQNAKEIQTTCIPCKEAAVNGKST